MCFISNTTIALTQIHNLVHLGDVCSDIYRILNIEIRNREEEKKVINIKYIIDWLHHGA